ncbi:MULTISPECIES: acyltransferase family protein [unclassified Bradyrhizobium]
MKTQIDHIGGDHHSRSELRALTGLRGVAATTIALAHLHQAFPGDNGILMWHSVVDLFFCLSGFTLSYVYSRGEFRFSSYLTARFARIYPLYFFTLIIAATAWIVPGSVNLTSYPPTSAWTDFLLQTLMLNSWPIIGSSVHWNPTAWSISIEWFCYLLLFPLLLLRKAPRSSRIRLSCMIVLPALSYYFFVSYFDASLFNPEVHFPRSQLSYWVNLYRGILGFTAGWVVFASFEQRDRIYEFCTKFATLIWSVIAVTLCLIYSGLINPQALVFFFPFIVLAAARSDSLTSRLLGSTFLHFLGVISYSIYMMHIVVLVLFVGVFHAIDGWPTFLFAIGMVFLVSIATYFAIEVPARSAIRSIGRIRSASMVS